MHNIDTTVEATATIDWSADLSAQFNPPLERESDEILVSLAYAGEKQHLELYETLLNRINKDDPADKFILARALAFAVYADNLIYAEALLAFGASPNHPLIKDKLWSYAKSHEALNLLRRYEHGFTEQNNVTAVLDNLSFQASSQIYGLVSSVVQDNGLTAPSLLNLYAIEAVNKYASYDTYQPEEALKAQLEALEYLRGNLIEGIDNEITRSGKTDPKQIADDEDLLLVAAALIIIDDKIRTLNPKDDGSVYAALTAYTPAIATATLLLQEIKVDEKIFHANVRSAEIYSFIKEIMRESSTAVDKTPEADENPADTTEYYIHKHNITRISKLSGLLEAAHTTFGQSFSLSDLIKYRRYKLGYTVTQVAAKAGCYPALLIEMEQGNLVPSDANITAICAALEIAPEAALLAANVDRTTLEKDMPKKLVSLLRALGAVNINTSLPKFLEGFIHDLEKRHVKKRPDKFSFDEFHEAIPDDVAIKSISDPNTDRNKAVMRPSDLRKFFARERERAALPIAKKSYSLKPGDISYRKIIYNAAAKLAEDRPYLSLLVSATGYDIVHNRTAKQPVDTVWANYLRSTKKPHFADFMLYWAAAWQMTATAHAALLDYDLYITRKSSYAKKSPVYEKKAYVHAILDKAEEATDFKLDQAIRQAIIDLRFAHTERRITTASSNSIADYALEISACSEPRMSKFPNNPVAQFCLKHGYILKRFGKTDPVIDKTKLTHALIFSILGVDCKFSMFVNGAGLHSLIAHDKTDGSYPTREDYIAGRKHIFVEFSKDNSVVHNKLRFAYPPKLAKALCNQNEQTRKTILAVILLQDKYYEFDEMLDLIATDKMPAGKAVSILRAQAGLSYIDVVKGASSLEVITEFEAGNTKTIKSREVAEIIASRIGTQYNSTPASIARLTEILVGKKVAMGIADIEKEIEYAFKTKAEKYYSKDMLTTTTAPGNGPAKIAKTHYELIVMISEVTCGPNRMTEFCRTVSFTAPDGKAKTGFSPNTLNHWKIGHFSPFESFPKGLGEAAKENTGTEFNTLSEEHIEMLVALCCNKIVSYNPEHLKSFSDSDLEKMPHEEKHKLLLSLMEDAKVSSVSNLRKALGISRNFAEGILNKGYLPRIGDSGAIEKFSANFTELLIPKEFPQDREKFAKLLEVQPYIPTGFAIKPRTKASKQPAVVEAGLY